MVYSSIKQLWFLFSKNDKYKILIIFFSILIMMLLEIVSVSLFYPLIQVLFNNESENLFFSYLGEFFSLDKSLILSRFPVADFLTTP